jgi:hypothetical protein
MMLTSESKKSPKKTLDDLLNDKSVITGKEVIQGLKEKERLKKEFEKSVEEEIRNRRKRR